MAEVRPFKGLFFNSRLIGELSQVICPPYDIISPQTRNELYHRSEYNFIRLEYSQELPQDTAKDNKYTRSAVILAEWRQKRVLEIAREPAIYRHDHFFQYQGREVRRRGITLLVRLSEWHEGAVRPHEGTLSAPKADRINLLHTLKTNTSPILAMFTDHEGRVASLLSTSEKGKPLIITRHLDGERHEIQAVKDTRVIRSICQQLAATPVYIADGHHRYESALSYQREQCSLRATTGEEPFNFVMMTLVDFNDPGLIILAPHRLLRGISKATLHELKSDLNSFFDMEILSMKIPEIWRCVDDRLSLSERPGLALFGLDREQLIILRLRDRNQAARMMPCVHSEVYQNLDVSIVDHIILDKLLGTKPNQDDARIGYSYNRKDAVSRVRDGEYQLALLLRPMKKSLLKAVADAGERMPRKSTYFFPKAPAGLIMHQLTPDNNME